MRMFVFLVAVCCASSLSFFASADNSRGLAFRRPAADSASPSTASRCVKKVALGADGTETGCLMQKRRGRAS